MKEYEIHWNHRLVNCPSENGGEDYFTFKEVYYDDDSNKPFSYSDPFMGSESIEGMQELVARLSKALEHPVLHENDFTEETT